jgi:hypothetical protein
MRFYHSFYFCSLLLGLPSTTASPTHFGKPGHKRDLLDVEIGTCILLDVAVNENLKVGSIDANINLPVGTCVCIEADVGLLGTSLLQASTDVDIVTSTGVFFNGTIASTIAQAVSEYLRILGNSY